MILNQWRFQDLGVGGAEVIKISYRHDEELSRAQRNLANTLNNFKLETIGSSQTDDEVIIGSVFGILLIMLIEKTHNLYLNHTHATTNPEYVDYEDEETDCSSDISEVILNLNTYKPSTSNRLISLTDPKYKQLTPLVAKSSQMRLGLLSTVVVGDRFGVSDRAVAAIASSVLHDVGLITSDNSDLVVDENKLRREKAKVRKDLKFQALRKAQALPLKGLYFDGRKDSTLIEKRVDTKRYTRKAKEEHLCLIEELGSRYITHLSPSFGTAKQISATIIGYFEGITRDLSQL
ncbi:hypothetical protein AVEN_119448-1 [Araneus ventricosus]|uniref:Uncharacterized protein n=1 Tax=Araneus ventricosus TaxID=182803 RepID=A0A4Y2DN15_ARAVE|nr:hypothetical protein AVEN_119448-1 [Araneus ventricosus]